MASFGFDSTGEEVVKAYAKNVEGKTIVVTGPSSGGLGAEAAMAFAWGHPKHLILAGRTEAKVVPVIKSIQEISLGTEVTFVKLDLSSNASVRKAAEEIDSQVDKIHFLINAAGVMAVKEFEKSADGIEMQFASNHVGHFLLTNLLMSKIVLAGRGARVINVSSNGYWLGGVRFGDWNFKDGKEYNPWLGYAQSKSANVIFSKCLTDRLEKSGGQSFSLQPGLVLESQLQKNTDVSPELFAQGVEMGKKLFGSSGSDAVMESPKTLQQGSATIVFAAVSPSIEGSSGAFLMDCGVVPQMAEHVEPEAYKQKLWELSQKLVGQIFP